MPRSSSYSGRLLGVGKSQLAITDSETAQLTLFKFVQIPAQSAILLLWNNGKKTALFASFAEELFFVFLGIASNIYPSH